MPEAWTGRLVGKMHNKGITYEDLAAEIGCTKAYISMILNGRRKPPGVRTRLETAVDHIILRRSVEKEQAKGEKRCTNPSN